MANANMLQIIIFCIFLGVALLALGDRVSTIKKLIAQGNDVMLKITEYVIAFSPVGICALMAKLVSTISGAMMKEVIIFVLTIDVVIVIYGLIWYPLMLKMAKLNAPLLQEDLRAHDRRLHHQLLRRHPACLHQRCERQLGLSEGLRLHAALGSTANIDGAAIPVLDHRGVLELSSGLPIRPPVSSVRFPVP